jgi:uncharacterized protein (DUF58 family)
MTATRFGSRFLKRLERLVLLSRRTFRGAGHGQRRARQAGVSTEFRDHRLYVAGDDLRHLDWNLYARLDRLYLKRFHDQQDVTVHLVLDASASMGFGTPRKLDAARDVLGALAWLALSGEDRVVLHVLDGQGHVSSMAYRGRLGARRLLERLATVEPGGRVSLGEALADVARSLRSPGIVVVASDFLAPQATLGLERLGAARHQLHVLHVLSPQDVEPERDPELAGDLKLVDAESGAEVVVSVTPRLLEIHRDALRALEQELLATTRRLGATLARVGSDAQLEQVVFQDLQVAGVVG